MKKINILFLFLVVVLSLCLFSCRTLIGGGFYPEETAEGVHATSEPVVSGSIIYDVCSSSSNDISVSGFDGVGVRWFYTFLFKHKFWAFGSFCYKEIFQEVELIYDFSYKTPEKEELKTNVEPKGTFWNIDVKGLSPFHKFSTISEEGILQKSSAIDSVYIKKEKLPFILTDFAIGKKKYSVIIGGADDDAFNTTIHHLGSQEPTIESGFAGLRNLFRSDKTRYLICDSENMICADFSLNDYNLYESDNPELFIPAIGVYVGIFRLMNTH